MVNGDKMSKSLKRVKSALRAAGYADTVVETGTARTAADAAFIRAQTGFAIGGVSPVGHLNPVTAFMDPRLLEFEQIWAAAGTPNHVFSITPDRLHVLTSATTQIFTTLKKM